MFVGLIAIFVPLFPIYGLFFPAAELLTDKVLYIPAFGFSCILGAGKNGALPGMLAGSCPPLAPSSHVVWFLPTAVRWLTLGLASGELAAQTLAAPAADPAKALKKSHRVDRIRTLVTVLPLLVRVLDPIVVMSVADSCIVLRFAKHLHR